MRQYLIKYQAYPKSQHPARYLEVVTDRIEWTMEQYQRNRHSGEWEICEDTVVDNNTPATLSEIRYKYDDSDPIVNTGGNGI